MKVCAKPEPGIVTNADYLAVGERNVRSWLEQGSVQNTGISTATAEAAERAVVRVRVSYDFRADKFSTESTTGALVATGAAGIGACGVAQPASKEKAANVR
jgi:acyl-CoA thioesterase FadM